MQTLQQVGMDQRIQLCALFIVGGDVTPSSVAPGFRVRRLLKKG
jgi:hypothetical protein